MKKVPASAVDQGHRDHDVLAKIAFELIRRAGGLEQLRSKVPLLIRRAIDEVIDTPRTGRLALNETEKTYIGTKIEILIRDFWGLPKGKLDLIVDGLDVDIKNTIGNNWMIPTEAIDKPCILIASDEDKSLCYLGIIVARLDYLTAGQNKDAKRSISKEGFKHILWLLCEQPYPPNFWSGVDPDVARHITNMQGTGGTERLRRLFSLVQGVPVNRDVVAGVARQQDYMKRLRKNGGARDALLHDGIALLSGKYDRAAIAHLQLPACNGKEFISVTINAETREVLNAHGYFD